MFLKKCIFFMVAFIIQSGKPLLIEKGREGVGRCGDGGWVAGAWDWSKHEI